MKTQGKFAIEQHGFNVKPSKDNGDVIDWKVDMKKDAREESRFDLDMMPILTGASKTNGLKMEVTPMSSGQPLPAILIPVNLMGTVKVTDDGKVSLVLRMMRNAMNATGVGFDMITDATLCVECIVGNMESLEEQATRAQADSGKIDGAEPLLTGDGDPTPDPTPDPTKAPGKLGSAARKAKGKGSGAQA